MKNLYCLIFIVKCLIVNTWAASFDCSKSKTPIEKMICSDKTLSDLDEELNAAYKSLLDSVCSSSDVTKEQKKWLTQTRAQCQSKDCLGKAYIDRIQELNSIKKAKWVKFHDAKLKVEFMYPNYLTVAPDYSSNSIAIVGESMGTSTYYINFEIREGNLDDAIENSDIFEKKDDGTYSARIGRAAFDDEIPSVDFISGKGWKGIETTVTCGISDEETGFHAAGGQCYWALISDGERFVIADTQGVIGTDGNTMDIFYSIRFVK